MKIRPPTRENRTPETEPHDRLRVLSGPCDENELLADVSFMASTETRTIDLQVFPFEEQTVVEGHFSIRMNPAVARSIAYSLLWHANDIESPDAWKAERLKKRHGRPALKKR